MLLTFHEVMVTKDDSRSTYEYKKHYIVYPNFEWWNYREYFTEGGTLVEEGFEYNSGTNKEWLSVEELRKALEQM